VTADDVDLRTGVWVLDEHKTEHATGEPRVVILTPAMVELTKRLMKLHPTGPLWRASGGGFRNRHTGQGAQSGTRY
jgi:hypothetical protein